MYKSNPWKAALHPNKKWGVCKIRFSINSVKHKNYYCSSSIKILFLREWKEWQNTLSEQYSKESCDEFVVNSK